MRRTARLLTVTLLVVLVGGCSADQEVEAARERAALLDADGDGKVDVVPWTEEQRRVVCSTLRPFAETVLGGVTEGGQDEQGCFFLNATQRPFASLTVSGVAGERQVLDAVTADWYEQNGDITSVSPRSAVSRSPFVPVPGEAAVAHIDCGFEVSYDVVLPPSTEVATHVASAEALLCT